MFCVSTAGALPILNWDTHLVRGALLFLWSQAQTPVTAAPTYPKKRTTALHYALATIALHVLERQATCCTLS